MISVDKVVEGLHSANMTVRAAARQQLTDFGDRLSQIQQQQLPSRDREAKASGQMNLEPTWRVAMPWYIKIIERREPEMDSIIQHLKEMVDGCQKYIAATN